MNQTTQASNKSVQYGVGAIVLALIIVGAIYLAVSGQLSPVRQAVSPLSSPLKAPMSPVATAVPAEPHSSLTLSVLHTNDTWGYVMPCG